MILEFRNDMYVAHEEKKKKFDFDVSIAGI